MVTLIIPIVSNIVFLLEQINVASDNCQEYIDLENAFFQLEKGIKSTLLLSGTPLQSCPRATLIHWISVTVFCRISCWSTQLIRTLEQEGATNLDILVRQMCDRTDNHTKIQSPVILVKILGSKDFWHVMISYPSYQKVFSMSFITLSMSLFSSFHLFSYPFPTPFPVFPLLPRLPFLS